MTLIDATAPTPGFISSEVPTVAKGPLRLGRLGTQARDDLLRAVANLHRAGALQYTASANASVRLLDAPGRYLVTARGLPADIAEDDFGVVDDQGGLVSGHLRSGIQAVVAMHLAVYARPEVNAAIHTHSVHATAFAVARRPIPAHYEPLFFQGQGVEVPVTGYARRNFGDFADAVRTTLAAHPDTRAVLLANHGLLAFHDSPSRTAALVATIEEAAAITLLAQALGGSQPIDAYDPETGR